MKQPDSESLPADPGANLQTIQLMGDENFEMPEIEELAKDLQALHQDVQVQKASTPAEPKEKVKYFHVSKLILFNLRTFIQKFNILYPSLFLSLPQAFQANASRRTSSR